MNKFLLTSCLFIAGFWAKAQAFTEKPLQQSVLQLNTAKTGSDYDILFKKFSEAKTADKWQTYYYAGVTLYLKTETLLKNGTGQPLAETNALAGKSAAGALTAQRDNGEINTLLGLIYLQRIETNASQDVQKDLNDIATFISKAEQGSPNSPRLTILKAKMAKRSGNTVEAGTLYQKALQEFDTNNASDSAAPKWGRQLIQTTL